MNKTVEQIDASLGSLRHLGKALGTVFIILMGATAVLAVSIVVAIVYQMAHGASFTSFGVIERGASFSIYIVPSILWFLIVFGVEGAIFGICHDMARGLSPFTQWHARRITSIAILFVLNAVMGLVWHGSISIHLGPFLLSYLPNPVTIALAGPNGRAFDLGSLLMALVCFSIAAMWRYAALLQTEADDLV